MWNCAEGMIMSEKKEYGKLITLLEEMTRQYIKYTKKGKPLEYEKIRKIAEAILKYLDSMEEGDTNGKKKLEDLESEIAKKTKETKESCYRAIVELAGLQAKYQAYEKALTIYENNVFIYRKPFEVIMELLSFFAGCQSRTDYQRNKEILFNKRNELIYRTDSKIWGEILKKDTIGKIDEIDAVELESPTIDIPFFDESLEIKQYQEQEKKALELIEDYKKEHTKQTYQYAHAEKIWEYIHLLRKLIPLVQKICVGTETDEEQWLVSIGQELLNIVKKHQCKNSQIRFFWIYPNSTIYKDNEELQLDFIDSEMDCPGLYYQESVSGKYIRVICGKICRK